MKKKTIAALAAGGALLLAAVVIGVLSLVRGYFILLPPTHMQLNGANKWLRVRFGHWPRGEFTNRLHVVVFAVLVRFSSRMFFLIHFFRKSVDCLCEKCYICHGKKIR